MFTVVIGMLLCVVIAAVVVGAVAIPARREGREVLTPRGEEVVASMRHRTSQAADRARERSEGALASARVRTGENRAGTGSEPAEGRREHADTRH